MTRTLRLFSGVLFMVLLQTSCVTRKDREHELFISVPDQTAQLRADGAYVASWPVSTSKFGLGDERGSYRTPIGTMEVGAKIGDRQPSGMVFKSRVPTGEILRPDAPGRDPIVSRILWLRGTESHNRQAWERYIYIHGTTEERLVGEPVSYGCIRMRSRDVIALYRRVGVGAKVHVITMPLDHLPPPIVPERRMNALADVIQLPSDFGGTFFGT